MYRHNMLLKFLNHILRILFGNSVCEETIGTKNVCRFNDTRSVVDNIVFQPLTLNLIVSSFRFGLAELISSRFYVCPRILAN